MYFVINYKKVPKQDISQKRISRKYFIDTS